MIHPSLAEAAPSLAAKSMSAFLTWPMTAPGGPFAPFFKQQGPEGCARIEAMARDMDTVSGLDVRAQCRRARVVYDLLHVIAKYGRRVISRVRVDAANQLRPARRAVKQSHLLLLRNPASLNERDKVRLDEALQANQPIMTIHVIMESLRPLWTAPDAWEWQQRNAHAAESGFLVSMHFASMLQPYWKGIKGALADAYRPA